MTLGRWGSWLAALALVTCSSATALAQERLDSSVRAWADIGFYTGDPGFTDVDVTAVTPVLRGELELSSWQLGLDLPFAFGSTSAATGALEGAEGSGGRLGNPTLHIDRIFEDRPTRGSIGFALAIPTSEFELSPDPDEAAANAAAALGSLARGMWNLWWYSDDAWVLIVPGSIESVEKDQEFGLDGAFAWFLTRQDGADNGGIFQIGVHGAAVFSELAVVGVRLQGVLGLDDNLTGDDRFQGSIEPYAELRLPLVWLGAGVNVSLDEPFGVFGDGAGLWSIRLSGGVSL